MKPNQSKSQKKTNITIVQYDPNTMALATKQIRPKLNGFLQSNFELLRNSKRQVLKNCETDMQAGWTYKSKEEWNTEIQAFDKLMTQFNEISGWNDIPLHKVPGEIRKTLVNFKAEVIPTEIPHMKKFLAVIVEIIEKNVEKLDLEINPLRDEVSNPFTVRRETRNNNNNLNLNLNL